MACVLIALIAIISGVGEGLHWIPGCGHGVCVGNTVVLLGIDMPNAPCPVDDHSRVASPRGQTIPIYDESQCAICSDLAQTCTPAALAFSLLPTILAQDLTPLDRCILPSTSVGSSQARSPPLV